MVGSRPTGRVFKPCRGGDALCGIYLGCVNWKRRDRVHTPDSGARVHCTDILLYFRHLEVPELIPCIWVVTLDKKDCMYVLSDDSSPAIGRITYVPVERDSHFLISLQGKSWHCNFGWSLDSRHHSAKVY